MLHIIRLLFVISRKNSATSLTGTTNTTGAASSPKSRASVGVAPSAVNQTGIAVFAVIFDFSSNTIEVKKEVKNALS